MNLFNSLTKEKQQFIPLHETEVGMYACGMTVYDYAHIGHGRKYVTDDILRKTLINAGYNVKHIQNITDVGHLVSDGDEGEDKLEKGAKKNGKTVWEIAQFYTEDFYLFMDKLHILRPTVICKATDHIPEQIALIETLMKKGHAYETSTGIFFSIDTFPAYGHLFGQNLLDKKVGAREEVVIDNEKKNPADFALWFKTVGRFTNHTMQWDSPWGKGFPGWHIECSAMSMHYLGETFDLHTGGIDHLPIHHPNEIAQSEAATGKKFVNYWVHTAHLMVDGKKMSKSLGNYYRLEDLTQKGYHPLSLRYLYLLTHYRKTMNFTFESLDAAQSAYFKLKQHMAIFKNDHSRTELSDEKLDKINEYRTQFKDSIEDDLNTPEAIGVVWSVIKSNIPSEDKYDLLKEFDTILSLDLDVTEDMLSETAIPDEIKKLADERNIARMKKDFNESDRIRDLILKKGFTIEDKGNTYDIKKS